MCRARQELVWCYCFAAAGVAAAGVAAAGVVAAAAAAAAAAAVDGTVADLEATRGAQEEGGRRVGQGLSRLTSGLQ